MLDLALHGEDGPVSLADIADRQDISLSYLEQLFARLRKRKLVNSIRGPGGGYCLNLEPRRIDVAGVITAVDERLDSTACGGKGNCHGDKRCLTHELWQDLSDSIYDHLSSISLQDLLDKQLAKKQKPASRHVSWT